MYSAGLTKYDSEKMKLMIQGVTASNLGISNYSQGISNSQATLSKIDVIPEENTTA